MAAKIMDAIDNGGCIVLEIRPEHLVTLAGLPIHHRDRFDHLLIAQAMSEAATLVSGDARMSWYDVTSVPCSDTSHTTPA